jgi:hypothetical protein
VVEEKRERRRKKKKKNSTPALHEDKPLKVDNQ